jgi:hypothetical protein
MQCPRCQQDQWCEGNVHAGAWDRATFRPSRFRRLFERAVAIDARACRSCGYVLLTVDPKALNRVAKE